MTIETSGSDSVEFEMIEWGSSEALAMAGKIGRLDRVSVLIVNL
jgi:hypothetical protein